MSEFETGSVVALREIWRERVWKARPAIVVLDDKKAVVLDDKELVGLWTPAGSQMLIADTGSGVPSASWRLVPLGAEQDALRLARLGARRVDVALWREGAFDGWKVDVGRPLRRFDAGFEYLDLELDVRIVPGGEASIVDEDEFAEARRRGVIDELEAAAVRSEAEAALAAFELREPPFGAGREPRRPDVSGTLRLLDGWDAPASDLPPLR